MIRNLSTPPEEVRQYELIPLKTITLKPDMSEEGPIYKVNKGELNLMDRKKSFSSKLKLNLKVGEVKNEIFRSQTGAYLYNPS